MEVIKRRLASLYSRPAKGLEPQLKRAEVSVDADTGGCGSAALPRSTHAFTHDPRPRAACKVHKNLIFVEKGDSSFVWEAYILRSNHRGKYSSLIKEISLKQTFLRFCNLVSERRDEAELCRKLGETNLVLDFASLCTGPTARFPVNLNTAAPRSRRTHGPSPLWDLFSSWGCASTSEFVECTSETS